METIKKLANRKYIFPAAAFLFLIVLAGFTPALNYFTEKTGTPEKEAEKIFAQCKNFGLREQCYAKALGDLTKKTELEFSFAALTSLQSTDNQAKGCHFIAHTIAAEETQKNPDDWKTVMNNRCIQGCSYGCQHGALEVHAARLPSGLTEDEIRNVCVGAKNSDCPHIVGHLLLVETERNIPEALKLCRLFPPERDKRSECQTGVFMEEQTAVNLVQHGLADKSALNWSARLPELEKLCQKFEGEEAAACWEEIVHAAASKTRSNPSQTFAFCNRAPFEEARYRCIKHGVGVLSGTARFSYDFAKTKNICRILPEEGLLSRNECFAHLASSAFYSLPDSADKVALFCGELDERYQESCFAMLRASLNGLGIYSPEKHAKICGQVPEKSKNLCLNAQKMNFKNTRTND